MFLWRLYLFAQEGDRWYYVVPRRLFGHGPIREGGRVSVGRDLGLIVLM